MGIDKGKHVEFGGMQDQDVLGVQCGLGLSPVQGAARGADEQGEQNMGTLILSEQIRMRPRSDEAEFAAFDTIDQ